MINVTRDNKHSWVLLNEKLGFYNILFYNVLYNFKSYN